MMNLIIRELREKASQIYNSDFVSVAKVLHHSKNFPETQKILKKYGLKDGKFYNDLYNWINENESRAKEYQRSQERVDPQEFMANEIFNHLGLNRGGNINITKTSNPFVKELEQVMNVAYQFELQDKMEEMKEEGNIMSGTMQVEIDSPSMTSFLRALDKVKNRSRELLEIVTLLEDSGFNWQKFREDVKKRKIRKKSLIDELCENLNEKALEGNIRPVIGRDLEIDQTLKILKKAVKNNPILVGKPGVGKTAVVEGLAKKIIEKEVPDSLQNAVIYKLQVMDMVKGTEFRGAFEKKISGLIEEFEEIEKEGEIMPILFIDEFHSVVGAGSPNGGNDLANFLKPAWSRGTLRTIGATTTDEWHKFIKKDGALDRRFYPITLKEPSKKETIEILTKSIGFYEKAHDLKYSKGVIERAVDLTDEFIVDNAFPDKAFDLVDYAGADCHIRGLKKVKVSDVETALSNHKKIPIEAIMESKRLEMDNVKEYLSDKIYGQDDAIDKISHIIDLNRYGMNEPNKPLGAVLMAGSTGVGKTEMAKQVSKIMKAHLHIVDMSEFMEKHSVSKLIGAPAGYVGYDEGSPLTKVILENPRTVLLLDEVEKAHPDVLNVLLQAMDRGEITDSHGKVISFRNVFLMMTTNAGSDAISKGVIGLGSKKDDNKNIKAVSKDFRQEFIARLDFQKPIIFNKLPKEVMGKVALKEIQEYEDAVLAKKNIKLDVSDEVVEKVISTVDGNLGARPIKGNIKAMIVSKLLELFKEDSQMKNTTIKFILENGDIVAKKKLIY